MNTFERSKSWWTELREGALRKTLRLAGQAVPVPIERELVRRLGRYSVEGKNHGSTEAWAMVNDARSRLLERLRGN
jgi:hypothetical protein